MKTIIAPTDFSEVAQNATEYALELAIAVNARLILQHVCPPPVVFSEIPYPVENITETMKIAEDKLEQLKKKLLEKSGGKIAIEITVKMGSVQGEIRDICATLDPYALVMGTQGSGAMERFLFGSNTISALKHLSCPVFIIPPGARFNSFKKVGLACDLKEVSDTIHGEIIREFLKDFKAELHIVNVNNSKHQGSGIVEESISLQKILEAEKPVYHFIDKEDITEGLNDFADKNKLDLLIIMPRKHDLVDNIFHRSQTKQLVLHTHIPVLSVHE